METELKYLSNSPSFFPHFPAALTLHTDVSLAVRERWLC